MKTKSACYSARLHNAGAVADSHVPIQLLMELKREWKND
jgi:hypothetical protein